MGPAAGIHAGLGLERIAREALDALDANVAVLDHAGRIVLVNAGWTQFAVANDGRAVGEGADYLAECERAVAIEPTASLALTGIRSVLDGTVSDVSLVYACHSPNEQRWFRMRATRLAGAAPAQVLVVHQDVTAQHRDQAEVRLRGRLLGSVGEAVLATDARGRLTYINRSGERLCAVSAHTVLGLPLATLLTLPDPGLLRRTGLAEGFPARRVATTLARPDGGVELHVTITPTADAAGAVDGWMVIAVDVTERAGMQEQLRHQALHDELTGLPNRTLLLERIDVLVDRARRTGRMVGVLFIDLDAFKSVNDTYGHDGGDDVLRAVAASLIAVVGRDDVVGRIGGDEFVVCCGDLDDAEAARHVGERILDALLVHPLGTVGTPCRTSASIGAAAVHPDLTTDGGALIRDADAAMYHAKQLGRGRVEVYDEELGARQRRRTTLRQELLVPTASQFDLAYQPQVRLSTGAIFGFEALLRWQHPVYGAVGPLEFIPLAEETGGILPLGRLVLAEACAQLRRWRARRPEAELTMSVNLSVHQLTDPGLVDFVARLLASEGLDPAVLCLEITESALMSDVEDGARCLQQLKQVGVSLAIDDFGTGYSSLAYLRDMPVDLLKIDREFVRSLDVNPEDAVIVAAIAQLATNLNLEVIAEGVETAVHRDEIAALGCDLGQGHLWSPALPAADLDVLLEDGAPGWETAQPLDHPAHHLDTSPSAVGVDEVVDMLRHELGSPLQVIRLYTDTLTKGIAPDGDHALATALGAISRSTQDIQTLIRDLTDLRWIDTGTLRLDRTPTDVVGLVQTLLADIGVLPAEPGAEHPTTLAVRTEGPVYVNVDATRIRQIFFNLLSNTARHTPSGTRVQVDLAVCDDHLEVTVSDDGPGIPQDKVAMLFRKFARLSDDRAGTGLGLYLSRGLARAHGGDLRHRVAPGGGVAFTLSLPLSRARPVPPVRTWDRVGGSGSQPS